MQRISKKVTIPPSVMKAMAGLGKAIAAPQPTSCFTEAAELPKRIETEELAAFTAESQSPEGVTAILPIADPRRIKMARAAVESFMGQTYQNRQLLIANAAGSPIITREHYLIRELKLPGEGLSIGKLRNLALAEANTEWVIQWDDDDWSHPDRIAYQMAHRKPGCCCMLRRQIRCHIRHSIAFIHENSWGIARTLLFPRGDQRYPEKNIQEDLEFWSKNWGDNRVVVGGEPTRFPGAGLHVAFWHGLNAMSEDYHLEGRSPENHAKKWEVTEQQQDYMFRILGKWYGTFFSIRKTDEPS